jgi:hypothetical protein
MDQQAVAVFYRQMWGREYPLPPPLPKRQPMNREQLLETWERKRRELEALSGRDLPHSDFPYDEGIELLQTRITSGWDDLADAAPLAACLEDVEQIQDYGNQYLALELLKLAYLAGGDMAPAATVVRLERDVKERWRHEQADTDETLPPDSLNG